MNIKTVDQLVDEALREIKTISADQAFENFKKEEINLIDIRENLELENEGRVENSIHIPRGKLEIYLDPNSALFQQGVLDKNKMLISEINSADADKMINAGTI